MKILFVSSGNKKNGISQIVFNQGESIKETGIALDYFTIDGKGLNGYFKNLIPLRKAIRHGQYDIIHAHYSLCGLLVTLASPFFSTIIVSLMGSFKKNSFKYALIRILAFARWKAVIVKSERMKSQIRINDSQIIPNGVQVDRFVNSQDRKQIRFELGFLETEKIVIFVSNPDRIEKNFSLCKDSVAKIEDEKIKLVSVFNKPYEEVVKYMLAADVLMLTSFSEGSPNVIKEAMAACCPIVTTNVGDVEYVLHSVEGCYVMNTYSSNEGAALLEKALDFNKRTNGLDKLKSLGLTAKEVAHKIISVYKA
jgi:teichuronic acid biosynthesis glycosyltransferase TuaC